MERTYDIPANNKYHAAHICEAAAANHHPNIVDVWHTGNIVHIKCQGDGSGVFTHLCHVFKKDYTS